MLTIELGIISKSQVRNDLLNIGYIEFNPDQISMVGMVSEIFQNGQICIINEIKCCVTVGEYLYKKKNYKFEKIKILSLQKNNKSVNTINSGEVGMQLEKRVKIGEQLYVLKQS